MVRCSLIIRCLDEARHLPRLLAGVRAQTLAPAEIIVVDSGSTDSTVRIARDAGARVIHIGPEEFSFGRSLNRGAAAATGDVLIMASAHTYPAAPTWLERLVAPFADPGVALVYGSQRGDHRTKLSEHRLFLQWFPDEPCDDQRHPFCNNANAAVRRQLWAVMPYDEDIPGLEDIHWAKRALERGYRLAYRPEAQVIHVHEESYAQVFRRYRREAMALRAISPWERMTLVHGVSLLAQAVAGDLRQSIREGRLPRAFLSVVAFRTAQYLGAWRGLRWGGAFTSELRARLYYPRHYRADTARRPHHPASAAVPVSEADGVAAGELAAARRRQGPTMTWVESYRRLGRLIDEVRRRVPDVAVLACSSLHPRNPVPPEHHLALADLAAGASARAPSWPRLVRALAWTALAAARDAAIAVGVRLVGGRAVRRIEHADVVLKTFGFGPDSITPGNDFYYGNLPALLAERGLSSVVVCGDARTTPPRAFARAVLARSGAPAVPEWALVPWWAPFAALVRQAAAAWRLRAVARSADRDMARVAAGACAEALTPGALRHHAAYYVARTAVRRWRPRAFVTLYEGYPWEKLAWHGVKAADPSCLTVGYQHTVVMRGHTLALTAPNTGSWELATPDVALCLGDGTRRLLEPGHRGSATRLTTFGTFRWSALRSQPAPPAPERRVVLVLPEGNVPECRHLFDAALAIARRLPDHRFVFRCHPILPFAEVRAHLAAAPEHFANVELSERPRIEEDFARASAVLYRGSSSVLYAVTAGLKIVYLEREGQPDNDALFELDGWRDRVSTDDELVEALRAYAATGRDAAEKAWRDALEYVGAYTTPVTAASVDRFLEAIGLREAR